MVNLWLLPILAMQVTAEVPVSPQTTRLDDVIVNARSLSETVEAFVETVTAPVPGHGPARWNRRVCVGVVNFQREAAQVIADRVSDVALSVGLDPGEPGCSPTVIA